MGPKTNVSGLNAQEMQALLALGQAGQGDVDTQGEVETGEIQKVDYTEGELTDSDLYEGEFEQGEFELSDITGGDLISAAAYKDKLSDVKKGNLPFIWAGPGEIDYEASYMYHVEDKVDYVLFRNQIINGAPFDPTPVLVASESDAVYGGGCYTWAITPVYAGTIAIVLMSAQITVSQYGNPQLRPRFEVSATDLFTKSVRTIDPFVGQIASAPKSGELGGNHYFGNYWMIPSWVDYTRKRRPFTMQATKDANPVNDVPVSVKIYVPGTNVGVTLKLWSAEYLQTIIELKAMKQLSGMGGLQNKTGVPTMQRAGIGQQKQVKSPGKGLPFSRGGKPALFGRRK